MPDDSEPPSWVSTSSQRLTDSLPDPDAVAAPFAIGTEELMPRVCRNSPVHRPSGIVNNMRSTKTVLDMWDEVWNAHDPDAVDRFVTDDVVVVIGGKEISGKDDFKD